MDQNTSPKYTVNGVDVYKSIRGMTVTVIAVIGSAVLDSVSANYTSWQYAVCSGTFCLDLRMVAIPLIGGLLEIGRRWFTEHTPQ